MKTLSDNMVILNANTDNPESLANLANVLHHEFPDTRFLVTTEELSIINIDKLEQQLVQMLELVHQLQQARMDAE